MAKHILSGHEGFKGRKEHFLFDPRHIKVVEGWNDRTDFTDEPELMDSIKEVGVLEPLTVRKSKAGDIELVDGERRLRATNRLISDGVDIESVPVIVLSSKINEIELYIKSLIANTGKKLTPSEQANSFKRLKAYGWSLKKIAQTIGVSEMTVRRRLDLCDAVPAVQKAVDSKQITMQQAKEIVEESDGKIVEQEKRLVEQKTTPRKRKPKKCKCPSCGHEWE